MILRFLLVALQLTVPVPAATTPAESRLIAAIRADVMKAHISFLASDLLEGRDTPSRGLELAEEYIAAQFRRLGLDPISTDGSYFQTASFLKVTQPMNGFRVKVELPDGKSWESMGPKVLVNSAAALHASNLEVVKISITDENGPLPAREAIAGKAVVLYISQMTPGILARRTELIAMEPSVVLTPGVLFNQRYQLRDASRPQQTAAPMIITSDTDFAAFAADLPEGDTPAKLSLDIGAPVEEPVTLRNVAARLPGADPALKNQHILLTAHHDHVGVLARGDGDRIFNGANDDASGVATVLALAEAFSSASERPKRTLIFMTYFGEEKGLLGSRYYASHPVVPLKDTVANLNFEQMGRTDDREGPRVGKITATGFDYTTIGETLTEAANATGVESWIHEKNNDAYFSRSDNQSLANFGVPAITLLVAWNFPEYHRPGDHWEKIDYSNMQNVVRTVALTVSRIANSAEPPKWLPANPRIVKYLKAFQSLHAIGN